MLPRATYDLERQRCEALRTQLVEAKAEAAPLRAALSNIDDCSHDTLGEMGDCPDYKTAFRALEKGCGALQFIGGRARAALSDAGKGWVSPEKVEQTKGQGAMAFRAWAEANKSKIHIDAIDEAAMGFSAGWDAALDALKGVE